MKVTDANRRTDGKARPVSLGGLVHGVVNSTASISFSASALRTSGKLNGTDVEALVRIEQAASQVADMVKRFASAPTPAPEAAPAPSSRVDLYEICCEIADRRRREEGRVIYSRAFGDSRGRWEKAKVVELIRLMIDCALEGLGNGSQLTLTTSGFGRHVRLSLHGLGPLSKKAKQTCLAIPGKVDPSLGGLMTVTVSRGPGTVLSMHLPR